MSQLSPTLQVAKKELQEMLRDRRVRFGAFILPLFIVLLMLSVMGTVMSSIGGKSKQKVNLVATNHPLVAEMMKAPKLEVKTIASLLEGDKLIREGKARLVAEIDDNGVPGGAKITLHYDAVEEGAMVAKAVFLEALSPAMKAQAKKILAQAGLSEASVNPIQIKEEPIKVGDGPAAGGFILSILPYLVVLFSFTGGIAVASDLVAGEKEKSTLETLLISPISRLDIVLGKWLALCAVCGLSGCSALFSLVIASVVKLPGSEVLFKGGLGLTPTSVLLVLATLIPLITFFAGVLIAVSALARNMREAQTYLGALNAVIVFPAVFSQVLGVTDLGQRWWINLVPVLNAANLIRNSLAGKAKIPNLILTDITSLVIAAIGLAVAIKLFQREQILTRS